MFFRCFIKNSHQLHMLATSGIIIIIVYAQLYVNDLYLISDCTSCFIKIFFRMCFEDVQAINAQLWMCTCSNKCNLHYYQSLTERIMKTVLKCVREKAPSAKIVEFSIIFYNL